MRLLMALVAGSALFAQTAERPKVLGVAHMAIYVKDLAKTRQFYEEFLGFGEPFTLPKPDGSGVRIAFVKVNENQYIEIFTDPDRGEGQLNHIAFYTDSADRMCAYLKSKGFAVMGSGVSKGQTGNKNFNVKDPDGHIVEFVEYQPDSWTARENGKFMPDTRISQRIRHVGVLSAELDESMKFYGGVLGFREVWRGSSETSKTLNWVNLRPAETQDHLELMLYEKMPPPDRRGSPHHMCLEVADAEKTLAELQKRAAKGLYTRPMQVRVGVDKKRQISLFDPDGTRVEVMEAGTIDGKPAPDSTAPAPHGVK